MVSNNINTILSRFPSSFLEEEKRCGYLITAAMKKVWAVELDLLIEFDRVCQEMNLTYFLDSGTLLGAVRHNGFIPWDDDIDVIMFRSDYNRLLESGSSKFKYPYFLQSAYTDKNYFRAHAQLRNSETTGILPKEAEKVSFNQGIFIDIFVFDGLTSNIKKLYEQISEQNRIKKIYDLVWMPYSRNGFKQTIKKILSLILKLKYRDSSDLYRKLELIMQRYEDAEMIDKIGFRNNTSDVHYMKREWFSSAVPVFFEGYRFPAPVGYKDVLKEYYGIDYMIPKQLSSFHEGILLDAEKSYKETISLVENK